MKKLVFYGHSDDVFQFTINNRPGDATALNNQDIAEFDVRLTDDQRLIVRGQYVDGGIYLVGVRQADEGYSLPNWPIYIRHGHDYSPELVIEAPDDVQIENITHRGY